MIFFKGRTIKYTDEKKKTRLHSEIPKSPLRTTKLALPFVDFVDVLQNLKFPRSACFL